MNINYTHSHRRSDNRMMRAILLVAVEKITNPDATEEELLTLAGGILGVSPPTNPDAAVIAALKQTPADDYPPELQAARRAAFVAQVRERNNPLEARARQIEADLQDPFIDKETALTLLDELAEIITQEERN
jgi:hypothetical protein